MPFPEQERDVEDVHRRAEVADGAGRAHVDVDGALLQRLDHLPLALGELAVVVDGRGDAALRPLLDEIREPLRSALYARVRRAGPDKDGKIDCDVPGRLVGNWFLGLMLSHGTPMIFGGDEWERTQLGNNNTYTPEADNPYSWHDWGQWQAHDERWRLAWRLGCLR